MELEMDTKTQIKYWWNSNSDIDGIGNQYEKQSSSFATVGISCDILESIFLLMESKINKKTLIRY